MKKHQFNFELISVVSWKTFPVNDPRATKQLAKAILMHGDIGYKFCWLFPFEDHNQGTPVEHESAETPIGNESNGIAAGECANFTVIWFQRTCDFHHKFGDFSFILLTLLIVSFTC